MKESIYKSYDELPLFRGAETVAKALGVWPSSDYELTKQMREGICNHPEVENLIMELSTKLEAVEGAGTALADAGGNSRQQICRVSAKQDGRFQAAVGAACRDPTAPSHEPHF